jgi:hypothetical protein
MMVGTVGWLLRLCMPLEMSSGYVYIEEVVQGVDMKRWGRRMRSRLLILQNDIDT